MISVNGIYDSPSLEFSDQSTLIVTSPPADSFATVPIALTPAKDSPTNFISMSLPKTVINSSSNSSSLYSKSKKRQPSADNSSISSLSSSSNINSNPTRSTTGNAVRVVGTKKDAGINQHYGSSGRLDINTSITSSPPNNNNLSSVPSVPTHSLFNSNIKIISSSKTHKNTFSEGGAASLGNLNDNKHEETPLIGLYTMC